MLPRLPSQPDFPENDSVLPRMVLTHLSRILSSLYVLNFFPDNVQMEQCSQDLSLVTSWAFSPITLASFRSLFGIYGLLTLILSLASQIRDGGAES